MQFLTKDFLLHTETAKKLYHEHAATMPILDYHCHIDPKEIYEDRRFENITQVWLGGDHYKWRLMRSNGVDEHYITGGASDREKFQKFAESLPRAIGNPMVHWCHLELKNFFGWEGFLTGDTAQEVWEHCNEKLLNDPNMTARGLIRSSNVAMIGTTDDPCDTLEWHEKIAADESFETVVSPTFRPDKALNIHKECFVEYIHRLERVVGYGLGDMDDVRRALTDRIEYFAAKGCRIADHGMDYMVYREASDMALDIIFHKAMNGGAVTAEEMEAYQTDLLIHCAREYARLGIVMQLHYSCLRNPNSRQFALQGPDHGYDCIAITDSAAALAKVLDALEADHLLPRTILYSLNPADNAFLDTLIGAFQSSEVPGKIQHGSAWWFNDTKSGMIEQMTSLANLSVLGNFIGMLTDSRSFLSYARHEYFRRILCQLIGGWVENGEYPADMDMLGGLVEDICCNNARRYFSL